MAEKDRYTVFKHKFINQRIYIGACILWGISLIVAVVRLSGVAIFSVALCALLLGILGRLATIVIGECPYCGKEISDRPNHNAIICVYCQKKIITRDGLFLQELNWTSFTGDQVPAGMTEEEYFAYKGKLKRKYQLWSICVILLFYSYLGYRGWSEEAFTDVQMKRIDELQVMQGDFFYESGGRIKSSQVGLKDKSTGKTIIVVHQGLAPESLVKYKELPSATIWYCQGPGNKMYMYQLDINGLVIFDVNAANKRVEDLNHRKQQGNYVIYLFMPLAMPFLIIYVCRQIYRGKVANLFGKEHLL